MKYLLDTSTWIWVNSDTTKLSRRVAEILKDPHGVFGLSDISLWEVAKKVEKGKLNLDRPVLDWIRNALPDSVQVLPISPEIAVASTQLKNFHSDPADQLIVATAQSHGLTLLASDRLIRQGDWVKTVW
ncbi:MAG: type II toxin-antitoxin system VapC family toxin [Verrucomicrobiota bacterium]